MNVRLVEIQMPLKSGTARANFAAVLAFPLEGSFYRVVGRQPGDELWRWPPDSVVTCDPSTRGPVAVARVEG
ncbi:hypothetical protein [Caulobacter sp.]|uniref:hypothetical protein n=1 Tax=Caulobacter sp. TaxID=78 RepID=UPI0031E0C8D3